MKKENNVIKKKKTVKKKKFEFKFNGKKAAVFYILCAIFVILTILVLMKVTDPIDEAVSSFMIGIRNDNLTKVMSNITNIGGAYSLIAMSLLLLVIIKNKKVPLSILINLVLVFLCSRVFKFILRRPRPDGLFLVRASGFSYPSGHAMVSIGYIGLLIYFAYNNIKNKTLRWFVITVLSVLVLAIGFSRIYLGVHYLTDVVAGFILGIAYLIFIISLMNGKEVSE